MDSRNQLLAFTANRSLLGLSSCDSKAINTSFQSFYREILYVARSALQTLGWGAFCLHLGIYAADWDHADPQVHAQDTADLGSHITEVPLARGRHNSLERDPRCTYLEVLLESTVFSSSPRHTNWPRVLVAHKNVQVYNLLLLKSFSALLESGAVSIIYWVEGGVGNRVKYLPLGIFGKFKDMRLQCIYYEFCSKVKGMKWRDTLQKITNIDK